MYAPIRAVSLVVALSFVLAPRAEAVNQTRAAKRTNNKRQRQLGKKLCREGKQEYLAGKANAASAAKLFGKNGRQAIAPKGCPSYLSPSVLAAFENNTRTMLLAFNAKVTFPRDYTTAPRPSFAEEVVRKYAKMAIYAKAGDKKEKAQARKFFADPKNRLYGAEQLLLSTAAGLALPLNYQTVVNKLGVSETTWGRFKKSSPAMEHRLTDPLFKVKNHRRPGKGAGAPEGALKFQDTHTSVLTTRGGRLFLDERAEDYPPSWLR